MLNQLTIEGRLTKEPQLEQKTSTIYVRFVIASQRNYSDKDGNYQADFVPVVMFGKQAERFSKVVNKGDLISIIAHVSTDTYQDKEGNNHLSMSIVANQFNRLSRPLKTQSTDNSATDSSNENDQIENSAMEISDDDMPF